MTPQQLPPGVGESISAIYQDAYTRGHRAGFRSGIEEKAWLNKHWPAILSLTSCLTMTLGIFIGANL